MRGAKETVMSSPQSAHLGHGVVSLTDEEAVKEVLASTGDEVDR